MVYVRTCLCVLYAIILSPMFILYHFVSTVSAIIFFYFLYSFHCPILSSVYIYIYVLILYYI